MSVRKIGCMGESFAANTLKKSGYTIVTRNMHRIYGEVDIIAEGEGCICFVEVRVRKKGGFACPLESVTPAKKRRIILAALAYLSAYPSELQPRFDLFSIETDQGKIVSCEQIKGVFDADGC